MDLQFFIITISLVSFSLTLIFKKKNKILFGIILIIIIPLLAILIELGYNYDWTGFGAHTTKENKYVPSKKLWDWMELFIVPLVLAFGALFFKNAETKNNRKIEYQRAKSEKKQQQERLQEANLDTYLDKMSELLFKGNLRDSNIDSPLREIARIRTLNAFLRVGNSRKRIILEFLYNTNLIGKNIKYNGVKIDKYMSIVDMYGADLTNLKIENKDLSGIDLSGSNMSNSTIKNTNLRGVNFSDIDMTNITILKSKMSEVNMHNIGKLDQAKIDYGSLNCNLRTGDIILFSGRGTISQFFQFWSNNEWSHIGLCVRNKANNICIFESTTFEGVSFKPFNYKIRASNSRISVKLLKENINRKRYDKLFQCIEEWSGKPFKEIPGAVLVAKVFQEIGLLSYTDDTFKKNVTIKSNKRKIINFILRKFFPKQYNCLRKILNDLILVQELDFFSEPISVSQEFQ